ncbi:MAG TPA: leucyl aminopeptidase [Gammaproteobacteria bacterium]
MNYSVKCLAAETAKTACLVVGVFENRKLSPTGEQLNKTGNGHLLKLLKNGDFEAGHGQTLILYEVAGTAAQRVLLVGCGKQGQTSLANYQTILSAAARQLASCNIGEAVSYLTEIEVSGYNQPELTRYAVLAFEEALYRFDRFKDPKTSKAPKLSKIVFAQTDRKALQENQKAVLQGLAIANGVNRAKTLGNLPGNICTPSYLAKEAKALQREFSTIKTSVLDEPEMKKMGMGALLSVSNGSKEPAKLIVMEYSGKKNAAPLVVVGKGITFDSGGISIKPAPAMDEMKFDMCGAASVFGIVAACAEMNLPVNLVGIVAAAENMPSGSATRPGDIVTTLSGLTVEILNTDAEGRLVLCDALTYAERFKPAAVIDVATLTGACIIALGRFPSGLMGNNPKLINALKQAGERSGDRVWELPLWDDYAQLLKTNFADIANVGNRDGGAITAASYLSHFTRNYPWAHLDIAGTAWKTGENKGATGRPVPLLMQYIMDAHAR